MKRLFNEIFGWWLAIWGVIGVVVIVGAITVSCSAPAPQIMLQASKNYLENPGFEEGFREVDGIAELKVANGWYPWWDENAARPEYKIATNEVDPRRVHSGNGAQQWFNNYNKHTAGIYQRVENVPVGASMVFEVWVQAFSSNEDDFEHSKGKYRMRIGVDPYGGLDPENSDVIWSNEGHAIEPYDGWFYLQVPFTSTSDRVTAYVWGQAEWALKHNDAYCDDTSLYRLEAVTPTPTITPTPGGTTGVDYDRIKGIVETVVAGREPEKWPR